MTMQRKPPLLGSMVLLTAVVLVGCGGRGGDGDARSSAESSTPPATSSADTSVAGPRSPLNGTRWRLVEFQSMDDSLGVTRPGDPSLYTMELGADGRVSMRLNCNMATGSWSAQSGTDAASGSFEFGRLAMTSALCPPPSLDERIARDAEYVRGYLLRDGMLHLSLMADAGSYVWTPDGEAIPFSTISRP